MAYFAALSAYLTLAAAVTGQELAWTQVKPAVSPPARWMGAMVYDSGRQVIVLFGGAGRPPNNTPLADTWEWDGRSWSRRNPGTSPSTRSQHAMTYDSDRQRIVLFGGWTGTSSPRDTWEWDGRNWTQLNPTLSPPDRVHHTMVYDSARKRTVLFGGGSPMGNLADTWEWDGKDWTQARPTTSPPGRTSHAMAYDSARQRTVVFGGSAGLAAVLGDTWEWDGKDWTQIKPSTSPTARYQHEMTYDATRKRTVLVGKRTASPSSVYVETWEWDGTNWTQVQSTTAPAARNQHGVAYDVFRRRTVVFGGSSYPSLFADTWELARATLAADVTTVSIATGGTQKFTLDTGVKHGGRLYWILGSLTGAMPGVSLPSAMGSVHIPLNPDIWTDLTIALPNTGMLVATKGTLDASGKAQALLIVPKLNDARAVGVTLHHAGLVYDASGIHMATNAVKLELVR
jgi:hypothetical protein